MRVYAGSLVFAASMIAATAGQEGLRFQSSGPGEFSFDTGVLKGRLGGGGKAKGLSSVVHIPSGTRLDASMGLCSFYRVFTVGKRYGTAAWDWPAAASLKDDGSVEVRWSAQPDRPFEFSARYRWASPEALEVEATVFAKADLSGFESFLASYFSAPFTNALVCAADSGGSRFIVAEQSRGTWQAYARDSDGAGIIRDGRWKLEPNPVDWTIGPNYKLPIAMRRAPATGLTGVLMSTPTDCFAICLPHQTEPHYSTYLSLFGRDLKNGQTAQARVRLHIAPRPDETAMLKEYEDFVARGAGNRN